MSKEVFKQEQKSSNGFKLIIFVLVVICLVCGGIVLWYFFLREKPTTPETTVEKEHKFPDTFPIEGEPYMKVDDETLYGDDVLRFIISKYPDEYSSLQSQEKLDEFPKDLLRYAIEDTAKQSLFLQYCKQEKLLGEGDETDWGEILSVSNKRIGYADLRISTYENCVLGWEGRNEIELEVVGVMYFNIIPPDDLEGIKAKAYAELSKERDMFLTGNIDKSEVRTDTVFEGMGKLHRYYRMYTTLPALSENNDSGNKIIANLKEGEMSEIFLTYDGMYLDDDITENDGIYEYGYSFAYMKKREGYAEGLDSFIETLYRNIKITI